MTHPENQPLDVPFTPPPGMTRLQYDKALRDMETRLMADPTLHAGAADRMSPRGVRKLMVASLMVAGFWVGVGAAITVSLWWLVPAVAAVAFGAWWMSHVGRDMPDVDDSDPSKENDR